MSANITIKKWQFYLLCAGTGLYVLAELWVRGLQNSATPAPPTDWTWAEVIPGRPRGGA